YYSFLKILLRVRPSFAHPRSGRAQVSKAAKALETRLEKLEKKEKPKDLSQAQFDVQYHTPVHIFK
ncbi:hypothetical protein ACT453_52715, partial [Bacillus sp. D-CC]